jgi:hypothetical protein
MIAQYFLPKRDKDGISETESSLFFLIGCTSITVLEKVPISIQPHRHHLPRHHRHQSLSTSRIIVFSYHAATLLHFLTLLRVVSTILSSRLLLLLLLLLLSSYFFSSAQPFSNRSCSDDTCSFRNWTRCLHHRSSSSTACRDCVFCAISTFNCSNSLSKIVL